MDKKRKEQLLKAIKEYTDKVTISPESAKAALVKEGIYNEDGSLHENFGGEREKREGGE